MIKKVNVLRTQSNDELWMQERVAEFFRFSFKVGGSIYLALNALFIVQGKHFVLP